MVQSCLNVSAEARPLAKRVLASLSAPADSWPFPSAPAGVFHPSLSLVPTPTSTTHAPRSGVECALTPTSACSQPRNSGGSQSVPRSDSTPSSKCRDGPGSLGHLVHVVRENLPEPPPAPPPWEEPFEHEPQRTAPAWRQNVHRDRTWSQVSGSSFGRDRSQPRNHLGSAARERSQSRSRHGGATRELSQFRIQEEDDADSWRECSSPTRRSNDLSQTQDSLSRQKSWHSTNLPSRSASREPSITRASSKSRRLPAVCQSRHQAPPPPPEEVSPGFPNPPSRGVSVSPPKSRMNGIHDLPDLAANGTFSKFNGRPPSPPPPEPRHLETEAVPRNRRSQCIRQRVVEPQYATSRLPDPPLPPPPLNLEDRDSDTDVVQPRFRGLR